MQAPASEQDKTATQSRTRAFIFCIAFLSTGFLPWLYAHRYGSVAALSSLAGDAFYYLDIAARSQHFRGFTFDGEYVTNGFHPLWQWFLSAAAHVGLLHFALPAQTVLRVYKLDLMLLSLAAALFCVGVTYLLGRPWLAILTVAPGPLWLVIALATPEYLSTWYYLNGMESALAWFFFSLTLLASVHVLRGHGGIWPALISVLLAAMVLSRLDEIFLAVSLLSAMLLASTLVSQRQIRSRSSIGLILQWFAPFTLILGSYLVYNRISVGVFLPLSGVAKAGFAGWYNFRQIIMLLLPVLRGEPPVAIQGGLGYAIFDEQYMRVLQIVLPLTVCAVEWLRLRRESTSPETILIRGLCVGVALKAAYNFLFVGTYHQGPWYFTVSFAVANLIAVRWIDAAASKLFHRAFRPLERAVAAACFIGFVLLTYNIVLTRMKRNVSPSSYALLIDGASVARQLQQKGYQRFLEFSDGAISFGLQMPSVAAFGLAVDREAAAALKQGSFLDLMHRRDVNIAIVQNGYDGVLAAYFAARQWKSGAPLFAIQASEFDHYTFTLLQHDAVTAAPLATAVPVSQKLQL